MSYDLLLFASRPRGKDLVAAFERLSERELASRPDAKKERAKRDLARALVERFRSLQPSDPDTLLEPRGRPMEPADIELADEARGIEVCLYGATASVSVPYRYPGEKARPVAKELAAILAVLVDQGGYSVYDPQQGELLDPGADATAGALARGIGAPPAELAAEVEADRPTPPVPAAGYSGTPLLKKLGVTPERSLLLVDAPDDVDAILGELPREPARKLAAGPFDLAILFVTRRADLAKRLPQVAERLHIDGNVWVAWPKKASGVATDVTEDVVREVALPKELVDNKVCAIDATWSGLRLCWRLEARKKMKR